MAEKKVFVAIEAIEAQIEATHARRQQRQEELLVEYLRAREPLLQRRYELVTGRSEPTGDELKGFKPQGAAAAAAAAAVPNPPEAAAAAGGARGKGVAGRGVLPFFWLNALCNQEELAPLITPRDRCALEYLEDVRYERGPAGMLVEFHFAASNPYFSNRVLRKGVYVKRAAPSGGSGAAGGGGGLGEIADVREEATLIDWKPGRSLLVRSEPPPAQQGKKNKQALRQQQQQQRQAGRRPKQQASGGGGKKGKKGKGKEGAGGGEVVTAAPRSKRQHGKRSGPAPDLPDPEEQQQQQEEEEEAEFVEEAGSEEEEEQGGADRGGRRRPCPSFFRFFLPIEGGKAQRRREYDPTMEGGDDDDDEDDDEEEEEEDEQGDEEDEQGSGGGGASSLAAQRRSADGEVLDVLVKKVVPNAVHLYLGAAPGAGKTTRGGLGGGGGGDDDDEEGYHLVSGNPPGDVASLALAAQRVLHALRAVQRRVDELSAELKQGEWEAQVTQAAEVAKLAAQRRTLLVGPATATDKLSIPAFWLRALRTTPLGSSLVQHRDERALAALADVRLVWDTSRMPTPEDPTRCADLEFEFLPNPYFTNTVLRKRFTFHAPGGSLNKLGVQSSKADPIDWLPGRDLTVRAPPAAAAAAAGGGRASRPRQVPSFFAFFGSSPGALCRAFSIPGQSRAAQEEAVQAQEEFMGEVINFLVYFAGRLAAQSKVDVSELGDERDDDEEEDEDEDEEEEDEEDGDDAAATSRRAARRAVSRAAASSRSSPRRAGSGGGADGEGGGGIGGLLRQLFGGGGSASFIIAAFVAIMILAQVLVFLDTLEFVRARFKWAA